MFCALLKHPLQTSLSSRSDWREMPRIGPGAFSLKLLTGDCGKTYLFSCIEERPQIPASFFSITQRWAQGQNGAAKLVFYLKPSFLLITLYSLHTSTAGVAFPCYVIVNRYVFNSCTHKPIWTSLNTYRTVLKLCSIKCDLKKKKDLWSAEFFFLRSWENEEVGEREKVQWCCGFAHSNPCLQTENPARITRQGWLITQQLQARYDEFLLDGPQRQLVQKLQVTNQHRTLMTLFPPNQVPITSLGWSCPQWDEIASCLVLLWANYWSH